MSFKSTIAATAIVAAQLVAGHSVITNAVGDGQNHGIGLGADLQTPRNGVVLRPFQLDTTRFRGASRDTVGETVGTGPNDLEQGASIIKSTTGSDFATVHPGGTLNLTMHQVNADGAGPYTAMICPDSSAQSWARMEVVKNIAGSRFGIATGTQMRAQELIVRIPNNQTCSGSLAGTNNICLVRVQNPALAGPFGGVTPVRLVAAPQQNNKRSEEEAELEQRDAADDDMTLADDDEDKDTPNEKRAVADDDMTLSDDDEDKDTPNEKRAWIQEPANENDGAFIKSIDPKTGAISFTA